MSHFLSLKMHGTYVTYVTKGTYDKSDPDLAGLAFYEKGLNDEHL